MDYLISSVQLLLLVSLNFNTSLLHGAGKSRGSGQSSRGESDAALYDTNYLDYFPGHSLSDLVNMAENSDYSPQALSKIARRDLSDKDKRAVRLIRLGKRPNDKRAVRLIRLGKRLNDKRAVRLIRLGKRLNDKRAVRLIRLGKRLNDKRAVRLIRLGKRENEKRAVRLIRLGKRAFRQIHLGKRSGLADAPLDNDDFAYAKKRLVVDSDSEEDGARDKFGKPIIRIG